MTLPFAEALSEIGEVLNRLDVNQVETACRTILESRQIVLYGCGREGLMMRAFCMRLHHLGVSAAMQGDMTAPPVGPGDLFFCSDGPGELSTVSALMEVAQNAGASVLLLTAEPGRSTPRRADHLVVVPARTMASAVGEGASRILPMGSVYEGALFMLFEMMVLQIAGMRGETDASMRARHTNLE